MMCTDPCVLFIFKAKRLNNSHSLVLLFPIRAHGYTHPLILICLVASLELMAEVKYAFTCIVDGTFLIATTTLSLIISIHESCNAMNLKTSHLKVHFSFHIPAPIAANIYTRPSILLCLIAHLEP